MIDLTCPHCSQKFAVRDENAGKSTKCLYCGEPVTVPNTGIVEQPQPQGTDFSKLQDDAYYQRQLQQQESGGGDNSAVIGWIIFILIFGVGNVILYSTTGIVLIPIRR